MKRTLTVILITFIAFGIFYALKEFYFRDLRAWIDSYVQYISISQFLTYLIIGSPLFVGVGLIHRFRGFFKNMGLQAPIFKGLLFALICTAPMLIGYAIVFDFNPEITATQIIAGAFIAGFIEELFYRGILFGQIYRFTKIGFIPAILLGALIFASGHLYQSDDFSTLVGIFLTTFAGAVLFAWAYVEWENNLWVPIFLHIFMNLFWMLFSVSDNALGGVYGNIFRFVTIALVIILTIIYKLKKSLPIAVNKRTLLLQKN